MAHHRFSLSCLLIVLGSLGLGSSFLSQGISIRDSGPIIDEVKNGSATAIVLWHNSTMFQVQGVYQAI